MRMKFSLSQSQTESFRYTMGYMGLVGMTWGWLVGAVMGQVRSCTPVCYSSGIQLVLQPLAYALAELSSAYPTSGGLYYWAYMTAAPKYKLLSCYVVAWSMIISTPLACVSITYSVGSLLPLITIPNSPELRI